METTSVAVGGKGSNPKTTLYIGGLEETVTEEILHAAFLPFGDIKNVNIPIDIQVRIPLSFRVTCTIFTSPISMFMHMPRALK